MLLTTHALTGAALGAFTQNPVLAFVSGIISHHILDALPHFDQGSFYIDKDRGPSWAGAKYIQVGKGSFSNKRRDWLILGADMLVTAAIALYIAIHLPFALWLPLICGALGGLLPDMLDVSPFWRKRFWEIRMGKWYHENIHERFHWPVSARYWYIGIGTQIIFIVMDIWLVRQLF